MFLTEIYKIEEPGSLSDSPDGSESPLKSRFWMVAADIANNHWQSLT